MKKIYGHLFFLGFISILLNTGVFAQTTQTFSYTGSVQTFTVPPCVGTITVDVRGAEGANAVDKLVTNSTGGKGGRAQGVVTVTPGQVINIYVGGMGLVNGNGGFNGGGVGGQSSAGSSCNGGPAGGGGGASDIRIGGVALSNRVIVAGGGGGSGRDYCNGSCQPCGCGGSGGAGGGLIGTNGQPANNCNFGYPGNGANFGNGGSTSLTANGGPGDGGGPNGTAGTSGTGGAGGTGSYDVAGGGGGGGYYGGGGGGSASSGSGVGGGGGGGGSSYIAGLAGGATTANFQFGDGLVVLTYTAGMYVNISAVNNTMICSGASATLSVPGMTAYNWSNGSTASSIVVAPTSNTTYSVSGMTGGGCPVLPSFITLTVSGGLPTLSIASSTNQTCLGKTATLTASGALTYTWSNSLINGASFNPSVTTTYTVIGANGCGTVAALTTITVSPLPVTVISSPTVVCAGSSSTLTAVSAANSYSWLPVTANASSLIVSPLVNTIYTVSVSDGTCSGTATVAVNALAVPTIAASPSISTVCSGVPVNLSATGGLSYTWTPGNINGASITVTPNAPTGYQVVGSNSLGCTSLANVVIITNSSPTLNIVANSNLVCAGDQVDIVGSGASTYTWSSGSNNFSISVNPTNTTIYTLSGTSNSCSST